MQPTLNIALKAARNAGEQVARAVERLDIIKSAQEQSISEFLTETAINAEKSVVYHVQKANPLQPVHGYYGGLTKGQKGENTIEWFVNPIDGATNFSHGLPNFALTLVCVDKGRAEHVVVLNPMTGEEFTASRGRGAQLNGKRIRVSPAKNLTDTLLATHYPGRGERPQLGAHLEMIKNISLQGAQLQDIGSPALALAYVAAGRYDAGLMLDLDNWQLKPAMLLIQEAGGLMGDLHGGNKVSDSGNLVAGNPKLFKQLLQAIHPTLR